MAGLPVSIGEVIELTEIIIRVYRHYKNGPAVMNDAVDRVQYMETLLEAINLPATQAWFLKTDEGQRMNTLLEKEISKLGEKLNRLHEIILTWREARPKPYKRVIFSTFTIRDVPPLQNALDSHMSNIKVIRDIAQSAGVKLSPDAVAEMVAALPLRSPSPVHEASGEPDPEKAHESDGELVPDPAPEPSKNEVEATIVRDAFKKVGIDKSDLSTWDAKKQQALVKTLVQAGISSHEAGAILESYNREVEKATAEPAVVAEDPPKAARSTSSHLEILCVDVFNGPRSVIAQAYLELLRAWTANVDGTTWLFKRVDSAGKNIRSPFRSSAGKLSSDAYLVEPGRRCGQGALDALAGDPDYFASDDWPGEKSAIFERVRQHTGQGLFLRSFFQYHYILCFEWRTLRALRRLSEAAQAENLAGNFPANKRPARIMMLSGINTVQKVPLDQVVGRVRSAVKEWLETELDWIRPGRAFADGPNRTRFLRLQDKEQKDKLVGPKQENVKALAARSSGCQIHVAWQSREYGHVLAIVGPKAALPRAEELVMECLNK